MAYYLYKVSYRGPKSILERYRHVVATRAQTAIAAVAIESGIEITSVKERARISRFGDLPVHGPGFADQVDYYNDVLEKEEKRGLADMVRSTDRRDCWTEGKLVGCEEVTALASRRQSEAARDLVDNMAAKLRDE